MAIVSQNQDEKELLNTISRFFTDFKIGDLLHKANAYKEKGVPVIDIFKYKLCNVFADRTLYMQLKTNTYKEDFSKNTYYRFLNSPKTNWLRFTTMLAAKITKLIASTSSKDRANVFIIDDSLFKRTSCKSTELAAKVFDHCTRKFELGYRLLTLSWSDGSTLIPVNSCLLSSTNEANVLGPEKSFDGRSTAGRLRKLSKMKGTKAMIELLKIALAEGLSAKYVLFDTWFSSPAQLVDVTKLGLDAIAMVKKSSKIRYKYNGENLSIKKIYSLCKKRRGRSKYLLSVDVEVEKNGFSIPAKIVCVKNKNNKKDWIAIISTDTSLSEEEIIRIYGKRWQIEMFFKTCKSMLNLVTECHSISYDALTAHVAIVFTRYMLIALTSRENEDLRTLGEVFFFLTDEISDITFLSSFNIIMTAVFESICKNFQFTEEQMQKFINDFLLTLPDYMKEALTKAA